MVLATELVEDRAANARNGERAERETPLGVERVHCRHQAERAGAHQLVVIELVAQLALELSRDVMHETQVSVRSASRAARSPLANAFQLARDSMVQLQRREEERLDIAAGRGAIGHDGTRREGTSGRTSGAGEPHSGRGTTPTEKAGRMPNAASIVRLRCALYKCLWDHVLCEINHHGSPGGKNGRIVPGGSFFRYRAGPFCRAGGSVAATLRSSSRSE